MSIPDVKRLMLPSGEAVYREAGDGFPVVIVAGLGLTSRFYERSYATFARAGLRLIVPHLPGTGGTPGGRTGVTPDEVSAFIAEFAFALGLPRALYVGHSLGTQSVLLLAMRAPRLVAGIALVGPTGSVRARPLLWQARGLIAEAVRVNPLVIGAVARDYFRVSPARYLGTWIRHRDPVAEGRLPEIEIPALVLIGGRDTVIDRAYLTLLKESLPDLTVMEIPGGSHALPRSQHSEFNAAVIGFARRVGG
jgi:pimeloyl-ACP methyl ester carboxylesterase